MSIRHMAVGTMVIALILMAGCGKAEPTATQTPVPPTLQAEAQEQANTPIPPSPTATIVPPTPTETPVPSTATATPTPEPTPTTAPVEEITFRSGPFRVVGDLQIPGAEGKHPAIIMVHGDGGIDRTCFGVYQPIMERFLRAGYAVFSWDKPGSGESRGELANDSEKLSQRAAILVDAMKVLKEHAAIDPERIGVWGISQAGYVMPLALTRSDELAFLIVTSGPAMDSYDQGAYLVGQLAFCGGASEEEARSIEQQMARAEKATTYQEYLENSAGGRLSTFRRLAWLRLGPHDVPRVVGSYTHAQKGASQEVFPEERRSPTKQLQHRVIKMAMARSDWVN